MASAEPVHLFDITSTLPGARKSWSPNTLRTRMVLNYKNIPYTQSFISYPDIKSLLSSMSVPPQPKGMPYTLPAIIHKSTVTSNQPSGALMDSLAIALHLDAVFPSPPLFPSGDASFALMLAVTRVLGVVTEHLYPLVIPAVMEILDERGQEYFNRTRSELFGKPVAEMRPKDPESRRQTEEAALKEMGFIVRIVKGRPEKKGVFIEGEKPSYADFCLVSWLAWFERSDRQLWEKLITVENGEIKALWEACSSWLDGQGGTKEWEIPR